MTANVDQDNSCEARSGNIQNIVKQAEEMARQVRKAQSEWAYYMWQLAGEQQGLAFDFWVAAQEYVESVTVALVNTAQRVSPSKEELTKVREALLGSGFFERTSDLAYHMWVESGRLPGTTLAHFWRDAARHVSAVVIGAAKTAASAGESADVLSQTLARFSSTAHLNDIREKAYLHWLGRHKPYWEAMKDWADAENEALKLKAEGHGVRGSCRNSAPPSTEPEK